jgi:outer membrane protein insertion porin family
LRMNTRNNMRKLNRWNKIGNLLLCLLILVLAGCNNTKHLPAGEALYTGAKINIISEDNIPNQGALVNELESVLRPKPNTSILFFRPRLGIYNLMGKPEKEKGLRYNIKNNWGEPPVLLSDVPISSTMRLMINRLENFGHFFPEVTNDITVKNRKARITYNVEINRPYLINSVLPPQGDADVENLIRTLSDNTILENGQPFRLNDLVAERERIDAQLKNQGYYFFNPDYLLFRVDSTAGDRQVNIRYEVKKDIPPNALKVYHLRNIYINTNYSLDPDESPDNLFDTIPYKGLYIISKTNELRPALLHRTILLRPGEIYSNTKREITVSHLMGLGTFQFVNVRFEEAESETGKAVLDVFINLNPAPKRTVRLELRAVSKSNNFAGPGFSANYRNRNSFRGAERFIMSVRANYETVISGLQRGLNSYELGTTAELQFPEFIAPFKINPDRPLRNIPKTRVMLGYSVLNRVQFFFLNSFSGAFGYLWNETQTKRHELNPISINYVRMGNTTDQFQQLLERNPILRRSFEEQLILGSVYTFTLNDQLEGDRRNNFFFMGHVDLAGNALHLIRAGILREQPVEDLPLNLFGRPYSQYSRIEVDFRHYYRTAPKSRFVSRINLGAGYAYRNSRTMPYVRQFFIGGANSLRAFLPRSVGPGGFRGQVPEQGQFIFFDQVGDIRVEGNLEYRFPLIAILKGAVFLDAGNIWNFRENPELVNPLTGNIEGRFRASEFHRELAVGTGAGLRLDAGVFVLRLDLGIPLRKPWLAEDDRWVLGDLNLDLPRGRRENMVLNIAIGYPF